MKNLKKLIDSLNAAPEKNLTAREWSLTFEPDVRRTRWVPYLEAKPASMYASTQNALKIMAQLGMVKETIDTIGKRKVFKYQPLKRIEFHK